MIIKAKVSAQVQLWADNTLLALELGSNNFGYQEKPHLIIVCYLDGLPLNQEVVIALCARKKNKFQPPTQSFDTSQRVHKRVLSPNAWPLKIWFI